MILKLETRDVWRAIESSIFGVLAFVNDVGEPRTAGVCYVVDDGALLIATGRDSWKVHHISRNPRVAMTVTLPKRIPLLPFIKVPAATVTFHGTAEVLELADVEDFVMDRLTRGLDLEAAAAGDAVMLRVVPEGDFVTYGIGVPMITMRKPIKAIGRAPCRLPDKVGAG